PPGIHPRPRGEEELPDPRPHVRQVAGDDPGEVKGHGGQAGCHPGQGPGARPGVGNPADRRDGGRRPTGDDHLVHHRRQPVDDALQECAGPSGQVCLVPPHPTALAAGEDDQGAACAHTPRLASCYCPRPPEMLQNTFCTWLPSTISTTITTTAINTRIRAYSTIP